MKNALIIEDEPAIARLCKILLVEEGFEVDIVNNGRDAQTAVEGKEYHLLLLDIRLPLVSGEDFYKWLEKERPETAKKVAFMTGSIMGGDTMRLLKKSGRPYLHKPFRVNQLKKMIERV